MPAVHGCNVNINSVTDARASKYSLGHIGGATVQGEDVESWLRRALTDIQVLGYRIVDNRTAPQPFVSLDVSLKQAYVQNVLSSVESVVRLTVRYTRSQGAAVERSYRGSYVKVNWTAGGNEIMGALNNAMIGAVRDIAKDLGEMCSA